jgi:hypothetical protein
MLVGVPEKSVALLSLFMHHYNTSGEDKLFAFSLSSDFSEKNDGLRQRSPHRPLLHQPHMHGATF